MTRSRHDANGIFWPKVHLHQRKELQQRHRHRPMVQHQLQQRVRQLQLRRPRVPQLHPQQRLRPHRRPRPKVIYFFRPCCFTRLRIVHSRINHPFAPFIIERPGYFHFLINLSPVSVAQPPFFSLSEKRKRGTRSLRYSALSIFCF